MPKTTSRFEANLGFNDGVLMCGPEDVMISGTATRTRNAKGDWSINVAAAQTVYFAVNIGQMLQKTGFASDTMNQFGGTGVPGDAFPGRPPLTGRNPVTPRTAKVPKGIKIIGIRPIYSVLTQACTTLTCGLDKVVYDDNLAPVITQIVAPANYYNVARANPIIRTLTPPANLQEFIVTDCSDWVFEMVVTTAAGGTFKLHRIEIMVEYNWN